MRFCQVKGADLQWYFDAAYALGYGANWVERWQPRLKLGSFRVVFCS